MEKFIGIVITTILVLYAIKFVASILIRFFLNRFIKKAQNNFNNAYGNYNHTTEGDDNVTIKQTKRKTGESLSDKLGGEYVDYEEIK